MSQSKLPVKIFESLAARTTENIYRSGWYLQGKYVEFLKKHGLTPQQFNVLGIVQTERKQGLPSLEVARRMVQKLPDITRLVDRLEKAGYVRRRRSETDRRVVYVIITEEGLERWLAVRDVLEDFAAGLVNQLNEEELVTLNDLLNKFKSPGY